MLFIFILALNLVVISSLAKASTDGIIFPKPISEISEFTPEFCAHNQITKDETGQMALEVATTACVGHARFQDSMNLRVLALKSKKGEQVFFIESDIPSVELLKPSFEVFGPYGSAASKVIGEVALQFDGHGVISVFEAWIPGWVPVRAYK
jgi:hypothetical protein